MSGPLLSALPCTPRTDIEGQQSARLDKMLRLLLAQNPFYQAKLEAAGVTSLPTLTSLAALRDLPFTTKEELVADQLAHPPFGTNLTYPLDRYTRLHQTSGTTGEPLRWLDTSESWHWWGSCWQQVYRAAGVTAADRIFFPFSFGPFSGFWGAWEGAVQLGALALSGGSFSTHQRFQQMQALGATVLVTMPSYALHLAEAGRRAGHDPRDIGLRTLIVAGEAGGSQPGTRTRLESEWQVRVYDHPGATEVGAFGFACEYGTVHINEAEFIAEVLLAESDIPVEEGELVLTNLGRLGSPVLRYRTGDHVRQRREPCPCTCGFLALDGGILGRVDHMVTVRGINLFPSAIETIVRQHPEAGEFLIELARLGEMDSIRLLVELPDSDFDRVSTAIGHTIAAQLMLTTPIIPVEPGSLPRWETKARRVRDLR